MEKIYTAKEVRVALKEKCQQYEAGFIRKDFLWLGRDEA